jgi:hypothetical protein
LISLQKLLEGVLEYSPPGVRTKGGNSILMPQNAPFFPLEARSITFMRNFIKKKASLSGANLAQFDPLGVPEGSSSSSCFH